MKIKCKNHLAILFILLVNNSFIKGQIAIDSIDVINSAKFKALYNTIYSAKDTKYFSDFVNYKPKIEYLKSKGFEDYIYFFKLTFIPFSDAKNILWISADSTIRQIRSFFPYEMDEYIFGFNRINYQLYLIHPSNHNDVNLLFQFLFMNGYSANSLLKNKNAFENKFYIEGVDLNDIYQILTKKNK